MPHRKFAATGKQVLFEGQHYADAIDANQALRIAHAMNESNPHTSKLCFTCKQVDGHEPNCVERDHTKPEHVVIKRSPSQRLADAEEILGELAGVFQGYAMLHAAKGTAESDEKSKRNTAFAVLILDFLAQGGCSHDHQVPYQKENGITSLICLGCGQSRMEFYAPPTPS